MRNFGLHDLLLVAPVADLHDRQARQLSTHGESILDNARIVAELGEAVADCILVAGTTARTGKLNAMIVGAARARGSLIAFGDSDTRPDRELLRELVETLMTTPRAGSTFAPVVIDDVPRGSGDVLYALMQNALYAPLAARAAAKSNGALPFIMGQIMVFKREALDAIGGVQVATRQAMGPAQAISWWHCP